MNPVVSYFEPYSYTATFPTPKMEEYRYSNVLDSIIALQLKAQSGQKKALPTKADYTFFADHVLKDIKIVSFDQLPKNYHRHKNYFKEASLAKSQDFYEITCTKESLTLNFATTKNSVLSDKVYIHVPQNQSVQIFLHFYTEENSFSMPMIYIDAQDHTHVELIYTVESRHNKGVIAPIFELIAQQKSHVSLQSFIKGIPHQRLTFIGFCAGEESHIDLRTGFYLAEKESCDLFVRIYHEAKKSTSNQIIKSVAFDSSQMNFNGLILANGEAHNIYAYQILKGMILGEEAQIFARPQLDIEYFELACSHGVSIGGFDPEELFYLKSRGVKDKDVYPLLLYGFFSEPFIGIPLEDHWISRIKNLLGTKQI